MNPREEALLNGARRTDVAQDAAVAVGLAGLTDAAAVEDEEVREEGTLSFWHHREEVLLYLLRVLLRGEAEPARDAPDMGVDDDALIHAEGVAEDHVGCLAPDAGEGDEPGHGAGDLSTVLVEQSARHPLQGARLVAVEAGRTYVRFELRRVRSCVVGGGAVLLEQLVGDHVYAHVGRLGGEHGRYQQLKGVLPVQLGPGVRVFVLQAAYDLGDRGGV